MFKSRFCNRWASVAMLMAIATHASGCYYMQAANGHWRVMQQREPISDVIEDEETPEVLRERLRLVQAARRFSIDELALPDNDSYRSYADIQRDFVVWNVFATPEFSLQARRWCFPVAGCVSYRGYFSRQAAEKMANRLGNDGYDVFVGGVAAYSTLGRFDDPVLSSMMRWDDIRLVGVLFHELAHQVLYIKGDSGFNESFATAVEEFGVERWLSMQGRSQDFAAWEQRRALRENLMALFEVARDDLRQVFGMSIDDASRRQRKAARLERLTSDVVALLQGSGYNPGGWLDGDVNNARLVSMTLYEGRLPSFRAMLQRCDQDIRCFYAAAIELSQLSQPARDAALDALARGQLPGVAGSSDHG